MPAGATRRPAEQLALREAAYRSDIESLKKSLWMTWQAVDGRNPDRFDDAVAALPFVFAELNRLALDPRNRLFKSTQVHLIWCFDAYEELLDLIPRQQVKFSALRPAAGRLPVTLPVLDRPSGEIRIDYKGQLMSPFDFPKDVDDYPIQLRGNS